MDFADVRRIIFDEIEEVLARIDSERITALTQLLARSKAIFTTGEGRSGLVARCFAMRLMHLGMTAHVVGGTTTPAFSERDLLVAISGSGATDLTCTVARLAREAGGTVVALTRDEGSALAGEADLTVFVPAKIGGTGSRQYGQSLFEQCALIALDAVALLLQEELGRTPDDMDVRHANLE